MLEHSKDNINVRRKKFNLRNGTLMPMHLKNRNGAPVRYGPFRALTIRTKQAMQSVLTSCVGVDFVGAVRARVTPIIEKRPCSSGLLV